MMLFQTKVNRIIEWKCIESSYVYQRQKGSVFFPPKVVIHKIPSNGTEALKSDSMGSHDKKRCHDFY